MGRTLLGLWFKSPSNYLSINFCIWLGFLFDPMTFWIYLYVPTFTINNPFLFFHLSVCVFILSFYFSIWLFFYSNGNTPKWVHSLPNVPRIVLKVVKSCTSLTLKNHCMSFKHWNLIISSVKCFYTYKFTFQKFLCNSKMFH